MITQKQHHKTSILIVEKNDAFRQFLSRAIGALHYSTFSASTEEEAASLLEQEECSIALISIRPNHSGELDSLQRLSIHFPSTDVIALLEHPEEFRFTDVIRSGAVDYICKPFTFDEIKAKLSKVVREKKLVHELLQENRKRLQTEDELRKAYENLEKRVRERTYELEKATRAAEDASTAQREFIANISHELRTPMHAILSFARLGVNKSDLVSKSRLVGYFWEIEKSGERLLVLLNNLLDLSKMEAEMMHYNMKKNCLVSLVRTAISQYAALMEEKQIDCSFESSSDSLHLTFDRAKCLQVVNNLLSNAVKYSREGGSILIELREWAESDNSLWVELKIADQGVGIPENELEFVFDKFRQSSRTRSGAGGTGLGLAICKSIIDGHGGKIGAKNRKGGGAEINFSLPKYIPTK